MPDMKFHDEVEQRIFKQLQGWGFLIGSATYHEVFPDDMREILQDRWSPTSLYIRGRADRLAVHRVFPLEFELDVKTHESRHRHDITLESLPLLHHMKKADAGVRCLYAHYDRYERRKSAFWVDEMPRIRQLFIPQRWAEESEIGQYYHHTLTEHFGMEPTVIPWQRGRQSGDPFIVIDKSVADLLPNWETLIKAELDHHRHIMETAEYLGVTVENPVEIQKRILQF